MNKLLRVLIKALMQLPSRDFQICLYMISDNIQAQEPVVGLIAMASHLTSCRFRDFWTAAEANRNLFNSGEIILGCSAYPLHLLHLIPPKSPKQVCFDSSPSSFFAVAGFYDAVRGYALHVLGYTFQRVSKKTLTEVLRLEGPLLDAFVESKCKTGGWAVAPDTGGSVLILPKT
jgi:translation initiation factor 3 subunit K